MQTSNSFSAGIVLSAVALVGCAGSPRAEPGTPIQVTLIAPSYPQLPLEVDRRSGNCHIHLNGTLDDVTSHSLRLVMTELDKTSCRSKRVLIDRVSGLPGSAMTAGAIIKNHGYDTQLQAGTTCLTPCLLLFASGRQRIMPDTPATTRLGFSQIPRDEDFGRAVCATELTSNQTLSLTRYLRAMLPIATATTVYQKLTAANCLGTNYLTAPEAMAIGLANVSAPGPSSAPPPLRPKAEP